MNHHESLDIDTIRCADCVDGMNSLPEKSIDLVFGDPPYHLQLEGDLFRPDQTKESRSNNRYTNNSDAFSFNL